MFQKIKASFCHIFVTDYLKIISANEVVLNVVSLVWGHTCTLGPCIGSTSLTTCLLFFCLRRNLQLQPRHSDPFFNCKGVFRSLIFRNRGQLAYCQLCTPEGCVVSVFVHFIGFQTAWALPIHYHKFPWKRGKDIFRNLNNFLQHSFLFLHPLLSYVYSYLHTCTSAWLIQYLYFHPHSATQLSERTEQWSRILPIYRSPHLHFFRFLIQPHKHCSVHSACRFKTEKTLGRRGQQLTNQKDTAV